MTRTRICWALAALCASGAACDGDWLGPLERGVRAVVGGWDMWATPAVRPYEPPMPAPPEGTVPMGPAWGFAEGERAFGDLSPKQRDDRARLAYRRFCHHCHGASGDGRIVVGESFDVRPTDLRAEGVQDLDDESLFDVVATGTQNMIALQASMTPLEVMLTVHHVRALAGAESAPYFPRQHSEPIR